MSSPATAPSQGASCHWHMRTCSSAVTTATKIQPTALLQLASRVIMCMHECLDRNMYVSHLCIQMDCVSLECSQSVLGLMQSSQEPGHNY